MNRNSRVNKEALAVVREKLRANEIKVLVNLAGRRRIGNVSGINSKTTWVRVMQGAKSYDVIKRHNIKHNVQLYRVNSCK
jgi:hypothetical protein